MKICLVMAVLCMLAASCSASASQPGYWGGNAFWLDLYPTTNNTAGGSPTATPPSVALPGSVTVTSGYLVLLKSGSDTSVGNWTDVVKFNSTSCQLVCSIGGANPFDPTLVQQVQSQSLGAAVYMTATAAPTIYIPDVGSQNTGQGAYNIYTAVPECQGILALSCGMGALLTCFSRRVR